MTLHKQRGAACCVLSRSRGVVNVALCHVIPGVYVTSSHAMWSKQQWLGGNIAEAKYDNMLSMLTDWPEP